jgi:general stress protein 26
MTELEQRIFDLAKKLQSVNFAMSTQDSKPLVQYGTGQIDHLLTFSFSTQLDSNRVRHIGRNPNVFLTVSANSAQQTSWLQVEESAEVTISAWHRHSFLFNAIGYFSKSINHRCQCTIKVTPNMIQLCSNSVIPEVWKQYDAG